MRSRPASVRLWSLGFWLAVLLAGAAHGQLYVDLKMERDTVVAHEPVNAVVTLQNRSGQTIQLAGPSGSSWLNFQIHDHRGDLVPPYPNRAIPKAEKLEAGKNLSIKIPVNAMYPVNEVGEYRIQASVYFPPLKTFFESPVKIVSVDDGRTVWSRVVGVGGGKSFRRYSLISYRDRSETRLYFRLSDDQTQVVRKTYSLGKLVNYRPPQVVVDGRAKMHVLYMGAPREHVHVVIDPEGKVESQTVYNEEAGNIPKLVLDKSGGVRIDGGFTPEERIRERQEKLGRMARIRRLSERPLGF